MDVIEICVAIILAAFTGWVKWSIHSDLAFKRDYNEATKAYWMGVNFCDDTYMFEAKKAIDALTVYQDQKKKLVDRNYAKWEPDETVNMISALTLHHGKTKNKNY